MLTGSPKEDSVAVTPSNAVADLLSVPATTITSLSFTTL